MSPEIFRRNRQKLGANLLCSISAANSAISTVVLKINFTLRNANRPEFYIADDIFYNPGFPQVYQLNITPCPYLCWPNLSAASSDNC